MKITVPSCVTCAARTHSVFDELNTVEAEDLSGSKGCSYFKTGQIIFNEGSYPSGLYCIHSGKVKLFKQGSNGRQQIVRLAKDGDILGYRALLTKKPYSAGAAALDESVICFIPKTQFMTMVSSNMGLAMKVMNLLSQELKNAENRILELAQKSVRERFAEALILLRQTYGYIEGTKQLNVRLTREEIASMVGTASESIIRYMGEYKRDGVIDFKGREITIVDEEALEIEANLTD